DGPEFGDIHSQIGKNINEAHKLVDDLAGMGLVRWIDGADADARIALGAS
ncbi:MAG: hypothetical protein JWO59_3599, partial [Chloroflexi bacterium]|nr:hypothetical protein [Chloroflexota bacterium]